MMPCMLHATVKKGIFFCTRHTSSSSDRFTTVNYGIFYPTRFVLVAMEKLNFCIKNILIA